MTNQISVEQNMKKNFTSFIIATAFLFTSICFLADILFPNLDDFGDIFIFAVLLAGIFSICLNIKINIDVNMLLINIFILIFMLVSYAYYDFTTKITSLVINYAVWGICVVVIMMQGYNVRKVINYSFWIATVVIITELITKANQTYEEMTWTYAILPCIAVVIVHYSYCRFEKYRYRLFYVPGIIMLLKFFANVNRGGLLSLVTLLVLVTIKATKKTDIRLKRRGNAAIALLVVILICVLFFKPIIVGMYTYLSSIDVEVSAISKTYRLIIIDNITNNRNELYRYAWEGFLSSPIWGNGIGGYAVNHGGWPHNFVLQLLYEGGIILSLAIIVPLVKNCIYAMKSSRINKYEYSFFVLLFSTSIPRLMVSSELWNIPAFWMLIAFCMFLRRECLRNEKTIGKG